METVIAIDPGSEKTGIAVVTAPNRLCEKSIVPTTDADAAVADYLTRYSVRVIVIGDGTRSTSHRMRIAALPAVREHGTGIVTVDECHTTEMAVQRYWRLQPPRGWRRWIPTKWQTPAEPVDDYAAWILAEKYFGNEMPEPLAYLKR